jgi:hypothetical protein
MEEKQTSQWTQKVEATFQTLKEALRTAPVLAYPQPRERFAIEIQDEQERIVAYYSKMLNKAERNYCVIQRELLAILRTPEHFHKYL